MQQHARLWEEKFGSIDADLYDKHDVEVLALIPQEQLLVYDVREGWPRLCESLEKEAPKEEYPNLNDTKAMQAMYYGFMIYGALTWAVYMGGPAGLAFLAVRSEGGEGSRERDVYVSVGKG